MKNVWKLLVVMALMVMMAASAQARTVARETVGDYTISVHQNGKKTVVKWNGKIICSFRFTGKVQIISERKLTNRKKMNRKDKVLYIERVVGTVTDDLGNGRTTNGYYMCYRTTLKGKYQKGDVVVSYCVYNPHTKWIDDITKRYDAILR